MRLAAARFVRAREILPREGNAVKGELSRFSESNQRTGAGEVRFRTLG